MSKHNYEPIRDYISFEDYLEKAGYRQYKPKVGSLGRALIEASKHQGRSAFINKMLDVYFRKLRQQKKKRQKEQYKKNEFQKQNSRHSLQSNASDNSISSVSSSIESNGCTSDR